MALLKSGSTVGGNLIWHQGILPLFPTGDTIYHKNYKIYTEKDKPTPDELNFYTRTQVGKSFQTAGVNTTDPKWFKFGTAKIAQNGKTLRFDCVISSGYNGQIYQPRAAMIIFRTGNGSAAVNSVTRAAIKVYNYHDSILDVGAVETSENVWDLYIKVPGYSFNSLISPSTYSITELDNTWTPRWDIVETPPTFVVTRGVVKLYSEEFKPTNADVGLSNVTNDAQVKKAGDTMTGSLNITTAGSSSMLSLKGQTPTPLTLERTNLDKNVSILFKSSNQSRYLGLSEKGELHWGLGENHDNNAKVYTTEFRPTSSEVQAVYQSPSTLMEENLNDVRIPGVYHQRTISQAPLSRNYPEQTAGTLIVLANMANGWGRTQEYRPYNNSRVWSRYTTGETGWSTWTKYYSTSDKPTNSELDVVSRARYTSWDSFSEPRFVEASGGPGIDSTVWYGLSINRAVDTKYGVQYAARNQQFWARTKENDAWSEWERFYTTRYKPTPEDVGTYSTAESDNRFFRRTFLESVTNVYWNKPTGLYQFNTGSSTDIVAHFMGSATGGSTRTLQLRGRYAQGGLWYRTSRDGNGFEKAWAKIYTDLDRPTPAEIGTYAKDGNEIITVNGTVGLITKSSNDYSAIRLQKSDGRRVDIETVPHTSTGNSLNIIYRESSGANISVIGVPRKNGTLATVGESYLKSETYTRGENDSRYLRKNPQVIKASGGASNNADSIVPNSTFFMYPDATNGSGLSGVGISISNLNDNYRLQLHSQYNGDLIRYRTRNGDNNTWRGWQTIATTATTYSRGETYNRGEIDSRINTQALKSGIAYIAQLNGSSTGEWPTARTNTRTITVPSVPYVTIVNLECDVWGMAEGRGAIDPEEISNLKIEINAGSGTIASTFRRSMAYSNGNDAAVRSRKRIFERTMIRIPANTATSIVINGFANFSVQRSDTPKQLHLEGVVTRIPDQGIIS